MATGLRAGELSAKIRGQVLQPGEQQYEEARTIWNAMIDRRPRIIIRCADAGDVSEGIRFARRHDLEVSVKGGGHNVAGNAVTEGGVMLDLSGMNAARIDPARQTVRAEPGLTWGEFDQATQAFELATVGGIQSTTGIAGFTLGGGIGWLTRGHGLTCDNLLAADVVTADGELVRASESENPDLFWGIRGGGGNFGIVTAFELQLHPIRNVLGGFIVHRPERARELLAFYREFVNDAPDELGIILFFMGLGQAPWVPQHLRGERVLNIGLCWAGDPAAGEDVLRPLRSFASPEVDLVRVRPYTDMQRLTDPANPPGHYNYWKAEYIGDLGDAALDTLIEHSGRAPSLLSKCLFTLLGGAMARVDPDVTAFGHRHPPFMCNINAMCPDAESAERGVAWAREFWSSMQPFSAGGVYVNFLSNEGEDRVRDAYPPPTYERLIALKRKYDPENRFHLNQNIKP